MKKLLILLLLVVTTGIAQTKGDGELIERSFPIEKIQTLEINLTADFILDGNQDDVVIIKTDRNLMDYISRDMDKGYLNISQKQWIQPSKRPQISIGTSGLEKLINDAHSTTKLINVNQDALEIVANVGTLEIIGQVQQLDLLVETASVKAENLVAQNTNVRINGFGKADLYVAQRATTHINDNGRLRFVNVPQKILGNYSDKQNQGIANAEARFINVKLKNNSWSKNKYVVVGPKADGSSFSYGFVMWPRQSKAERWTIGSKVYRVNRMGKRKLVAQLTVNDKNEVVKLF
ncbi:GIN domain-containing protein [Maribacter sp. IgM3_T14_3]|uniref:GIN domain-containing protein n=1 Tax=Maribacter sp. IgM3_T14_3 TaxID=3415140 RepID=UPI003C702832